MTKCRIHGAVEPCLYCERGFDTSFDGWRDRLEALERLFRTIERESIALAGRLMTSPDPNLPLRQFKNKDAIAVVRDVGIGDLVMLGPSLKALKEKTQKPLVLVTKPENFEIFAGASYLDGLFPLKDFRKEVFSQTFDLCLAVETVNNGGKLPLDEYFAKPRPQVFAEKLGVELPKLYHLEPHQGSVALMRGYLGVLKRPLIGLAPTCRSPLRTMPPEYVEPLVRKLRDYGGTVILLGKTESWNRDLADLKIPGMMNFINRLTIKDLIAAIYLLDLFIAPNTGTLHIAGALGIKTLAIEGNNDPKIFVNYYPATKALSPTSKELPCVPCGDQHRTCAIKPKQYGADCMRLLTPERIHSACHSFYNGKNVAFVRDISIDHVGGAEITDINIIRLGNEAGYNVRLFTGNDVESLYSIFDYDLIIVSNVWLLDKAKLDIIMKAIKKVPFIKFEHDHRSLDKVVNGIFQKEEYAEKLFSESIFNVFVSPAHRDDYRKGLKTDGICVFPPMDIKMYRPIPGITRMVNSGLLGVPRKANLKEDVRGHSELLEFRKANPHIKLEILTKIVPPDQMPEVYSKYEYFVHLPMVKWSCERVIFEAALCGCKVVTNHNAEGVSWGQDLTDPDALRKWIAENQSRFWKEVELKMNWRKDEISRHRSDSLRRLSPGPVALEKRA